MQVRSGGAVYQRKKRSRGGWNQSRSASTTGLLQGVGEDGQAGVVQQAGGEEAVVVGGLCEVQHGGRQPGGGEGDGAEGVAEEVSQHVGLCCMLCERGGYGFGSPL